MKQKTGGGRDGKAVLTAVRNASTDQLQAWTARVLTADTLDQLLR